MAAVIRCHCWRCVDVLYIDCAHFWAAHRGDVDAELIELRPLPSRPQQLTLFDWERAT